MSHTYGIVTGEVKDVQDPQGEGRVLVTFPRLPGNNQGYWAPVATLMSGNGRGSWFMPEVGDEVVVAFDHGDVNHPFILGYLWNGQQKPPDTDHDASVRRLKTVSAHELVFDDRSGQERILLHSHGDNKIELKDSPVKTITVSTPGGNKIEIQDMPAGVKLQTSGGVQISISDAPPGVTISAPTGILTVNCMQANVSASSIMSVTAPMVSFSGVVQTTTLIASTVISSAYTPGVGNTFGL